ncbi:SDR family oxidoreductase [Bartonella apihabitans]|uniref:SDR family oxidoreductase n=1 Tax=uncultured Bartonella sp. TaxID=104108 RepID=UPI0025EA1D6D|nr:SDR family oxidoreductase [Bartonella apihabitans]WLT09370.1 SDR family oxidoreductase [Bartonella apihabitans]
MDLGISGRKAIICASSKGLGKACAIALANEGCDVIINGRHADSLHKAAQEIKALTRKTVIEVVGDVSTSEGQHLLLEQCPEPDILVTNNHGPQFRDFRELDRGKIVDGVIQNMITPIELIKAVIDKMVQKKFGRIVNITSTSVYAPIAGLDLSSGARAGLTSFLAGIARTVVCNNVTINNLLPGPFLTDRLKQSFDAASGKTGISADTIMKERQSQNPAKRFGNPEEFGQACAFLCSEKSGFITGQNLIIDGGSYLSAF